MGATESNVHEVPTYVDKKTFIQNDKSINLPENIGNNKIISLLGLDDHEKYFESTDSEISELNEEHNKKKTGEILYFNETTFHSNSTLRDDDYCMRKCCTAVTPKVGEFVNLIENANKSGINKEACEMNCPSKLHDNNKIEGNNLPSHQISTSPQTLSYAERKLLCSTVPRCNMNTCPGWNKLQNGNPNKLNASLNQNHTKNLTEGTKSLNPKNNNNKDTFDVNMTNLSNNKTSGLYKEYVQNIDGHIKDSIPTPSLKPTVCLKPHTCRRVKLNLNKTAQDASDLPITGSTYAHGHELPSSSRSAPQQQYINPQSNLDAKFGQTSKSPETESAVPPHNLHKKTQHTGTNTYIAEERIPCNASNKLCQLKSNITSQRQEKQQTCNRRKNRKCRNSKSSTNYTYDEETTQSTGYTNCDSETYNTTYSSESPSDQMQDGPCHCRCRQCQYAYHVHHATVVHGQDVSSASATDELCSNYSDRSDNNNEYLNLAYQKACDYPVLVDELESTLSHRNRNHIKTTMKQFDMLGSHNTKMEKPIYEEGESSYDAYESNCYEKEYCCHKCQKILQNQKHDFHYSDMKSPLKKYVTNQQIGNTIGDSKNKLSQNEVRNKNFISTAGHAEKPANFMEQQINYKIDKCSSKCGNKQMGWKINSHTGDWEKVEETENYEYDWNDSRMIQPSSISKIKQDGFVLKKNGISKNASPCVCKTCQYRK